MNKINKYLRGIGFLILLLFTGNLFACSSFPYSFCFSIANGNTSLPIIYGKITDTIPSGIKLEVYRVFRGTELRDTITVWDNKYFYCQDTFLNRAKILGNIGDSVFLVTAKIISTQYPWEVAGDYTAPNAIAVSRLAVRQDSVRGFIFGISVNDPTSIFVYPLQEFLQVLSSPQICSGPLGIEDINALNHIIVYPNPTTDYIAINNLPLNAALEIISIDGQYVGDVSLNDNRISTAHLAAGSYLLKISYQGETGFRRIVKL